MPYSQETIDKYLQSLNDIEKIAIEIAKEDFGNAGDVTKFSQLNFHEI